jgi:Uma2 family endonuclease
LEPDLHFPDPTEAGAIDALVPDLAGWRRERMLVVPDVAAFTLAPYWICEVLSKSTEDVDREEEDASLCARRDRACVACRTDREDARGLYA